jgi:hypothetical protein
MSLRLVAMAALTAALLTSYAAHAQEAAAPPVRSACAADRAKFCGDVSKDQMKSCMMSHRADFSPECKSAIAARNQAMRAQRAAGAPAQPTPGGPPPQQ